MGSKKQGKEGFVARMMRKAFREVASVERKMLPEVTDPQRRHELVSEIICWRTIPDKMMKAIRKRRERAAARARHHEAKRQAAPKAGSPLKCRTRSGENP